MTCQNSSKILYLDLETYSDEDISKTGVYKYSEGRDFHIMLLGYAYDDEAVQVVDMSKCEKIPENVLEGILDSNVIKIAHNASFERVCLSNHIYHKSNKYLPPEEWQDTMIMASELGYPASLDTLGKALRIPEDKAKMKEGKALIRYFCVPCAPTKSNGGRTRNLPEHAPDKWETMIEYNRRDVEVLRDIYKMLNAKPEVPQQEWQAWYIDQHINDNGLEADKKLIDSVLGYWKEYSEKLKQEAQLITGLSNPNSLAQLKSWIEEQEGHSIESLDKKAVDALLKDPDISVKTRRVLEIRKELGTTSISKYEAFKRMMCKDNRVRGCFQFYGGRTGRWAGRGVQFQNLPRPKFDDLDSALELVKAHDWETLEALYGDISDVFMTLIRPTAKAKEGYMFAVADYSAIEARVIAWLSDTRWRMETFKNGGDIYCESASQMFGVPVVKHGENGHLRQKGKIAELALGYGGGVKALEAMGGKEAGWSEEEMTDIVSRWRERSPNIKKLWADIENAFREVVKGRPIAFLPHHMAVWSKGSSIYVKLPSGRSLAYVEPMLTDGKLMFMGMNQVTRKWERIGTWGGKLTENIVQAIARDCLVETMKGLKDKGLIVNMHVHDEIIVEVPENEAEQKLDEIYSIMAKPIGWAPGLILKGDGFTSRYYKKD